MNNMTCGICGGEEEIKHLDKPELKLISLRCNSELTSENLCKNHYNKLILNYEFYQRVCCDPFRLHRKSVKKNLRPINLELYESSKSVCELIPGNKVCNSCRLTIAERMSLEEEPQSSSQEPQSSSQSSGIIPGSPFINNR